MYGADMGPRKNYRQSLPAILVVGCLLFSCAKSASASESDPWTYAHIPLTDSAKLVSMQLKNAIQAVIDTINAAPLTELQSLDDTELEFSFFAEFRSQHIRDLTWGMFEKCIGTNSCRDWPRFERIQMYPEESVYHAARWRFIPSRFHLASIIEVCGVRMGADKLTHFFDDAFHYFNALRSRRKQLEPEDIRQLSMVFEKSYMGTRLTGIVSRADVEANLAGIGFYSDFFIGDAPMIGRQPNGRLQMLREPDICDYVTAQYDERLQVNEFTFSLMDTTRAQKRAEDLQNIIKQRIYASAAMAQKLRDEELSAQTEKILQRRIPMTHWQSEFPKIRLVGHAAGMVSQWVVDPGFRRVSNLFGFDPLKPGKVDDRIPVKMRRVNPANLTN